METKKLNLGCGPSWKEQYPDFEGLDIHDYGQVHITDAIEFFNYQKTIENSNLKEEYGMVMANHFMEHFDQDQLQIIFKGVFSLLKNGGIFKIVVPHKDKDKSWVLSHKTFWCEETFRWLEREDAESVYGFGKWKIKSLVTNERKDIHCELIKI